MFQKDGPSFVELMKQALASTERGYDMIAIFGAHRFHHTRRDDAGMSSGALIAQAARPLRDAIHEILSA